MSGINWIPERDETWFYAALRLKYKYGGGKDRKGVF
jgi:hypothetical protein